MQNRCNIGSKDMHRLDRSVVDDVCSRQDRRPNTIAGVSAGSSAWHRRSAQWDSISLSKAASTAEMLGM